MFSCLCYRHTQPDFEPGPYGIKSFSTPIDPDVRPCHNALHEDNAVYDKGQCGFTLRVDVGQCG
jgi:hypothetical protein